MPLPRQTQRGMTFEDLLGLNPEPGQEPSGIAFNDYLANIPPTYEQQREGDILQNMDQRAEIGIRSDLQNASNIRNARQLGFGKETGNPLREMFDIDHKRKLELVEAQSDAGLQKFLLGQQLLGQRQDAKDDRIDARQEASQGRIGDRMAANDRRDSLLREAATLANPNSPAPDVPWYQDIADIFGAGFAETERKNRVENLRRQAMMAPEQGIATDQTAAPQSDGWQFTPSGRRMRVR